MTTKTIGQQLKLKAADYPLCIKNSANEIIYYEDSYNDYYKQEFKKINGKILRTKFSNSKGIVKTWQYDKQGREILYKEIRPGRDAFWSKCERDDIGRKIKHETSKGYVEKIAYDDLNRPILREWPGKCSVKITYDELNRVIRNEDSRGFIEKFTYDEYGDAHVETSYCPGAPEVNTMTLNLGTPVFSIS